MKLRNKKTGNIIEYDEEVIYYRKLTSNGHEDWTPYHPEDWEDYTPAEPLIKDEKIRKAVRAWAEAIGIDTTKIKVSKGSNNTAIIGWIKGRFGGLSIDFSTYMLEELEDGKVYTINELCGEEEECGV